MKHCKIVVQAYTNVTIEVPPEIADDVKAARQWAEKEAQRQVPPGLSTKVLEHWVRG